MFPGEASEDMEVVCPDCETTLKSKVLQSNAGYYLGHFCPNCGPYDRQTEYMTKEMAEQMLNLWEEVDTPLFLRSDEFNG